MGSGRWLGSRTRRYTKKTLAFIVPLALLVSMMLSNAPLASAQDASPSPTADPSPTEEPTTAPTLAPSASDAPSTDAPSPIDSPSATDASPAPPPETPTEPAVPSDTSSPAVTNYASLIVRTVPGLTDADIADAIAAGGGTEVSSVPALRLHVVQVDAATVADSIAAYSADARVESVDRDRTRDAEATPNDPAYPDQWSLPQIGWDQAYGSSTISGVSTIAVLDTGVQSSDVPTGPGWSAFGEDPAIDPNGHGTWIASIAGATTDNGQGIAGVGFDGINIMPVQVLDATGTGQDSDIIAGLVWAADHGANVAVMAFSNPGYSAALQDAANYAWNHGVVVVAAAGNDGGTSPNYPAGDSKVVGVGATDQTDSLWSGSNSSDAVFITAPGVGIKADDTIADTVSVTGTSASAAIVAGAAAQLLAADPSASPGVIVGRLARNADPDGGVGNGRVNLARALADSGTASVVPGGAPGGGPVVGPYQVSARNWLFTFAGTGGGSVTITPSTGTINAPTTCGGSGTAQSSQTVTSTCSPNITTSVNAATVTFNATASGGSTFAGWSGQADLSPSTCSGTTNPCSAVLGSSATLTVTFNAAAVNQPPVNTVPGAQTTNEDASKTFSLGGANQISIADPDAGVAAVRVSLTATNGTLTLSSPAGLSFACGACSGDGTADASMTFEGTISAINTALDGLVFAPMGNFNGSATLSITTNDLGNTGTGGAKTDTDAVSITVNPVNDVPSFTKGADQTVNEDAGAQSVSGWATAISAGPANESGQTVNFVVSNDTNTLFLAQPAVSSSGTLDYTPAANANGSATVSVQIHDNGGTANGGIDTSAFQTFTVTVNAVNDVPSFTKGADQNVNEDAGPQSVSGWATAISAGPANESGQTVNFVVSNNNAGLFSTQPAVAANGTLTYTPAANANSSATVSVLIHDNGGTANGGVDTSAAQTFTITVNAVNDAPSFTKGADQIVNEDAGAQSVSGWATATSPGPADESGQTVNFLVSNDNNALFSAQPAIAANGTLSYTPAANANGSATLSVQIQDNGGTANGGVDTSAAQTFTITVNAVNDAPVLDLNGASAGIDTSANFTEGDTPVTLAPSLVLSDVDSTNMSAAAITLRTQPGGTVPIDGSAEILDGDMLGACAFQTTFSYNSTTGVLTIIGSASIASYQACLRTITYENTSQNPSTNTRTADFQVFDSSGLGNSPVPVATITVNAVNDAPVAASDSYSTNEDTNLSTTATTGVLNNDTDVDTPHSSLTAVLVAGPSHAASFTLNADGSFSYTPAPNYNGSDSFTYKANDGSLNSNIATVSLTVYAVNDAPVCSNVSLTTDEDTPGDVAPDCTDVDGDTLTYSIVSGASHGTASVVSGLLHYSPAANYNGSDSFTYQANDGFLDSNTATVNVTVNAVNDPPVVTLTGSAGNVDEGSTFHFTYTTTDPDTGETFSDTITGCPGSVTNDVIDPTTGDGSFDCSFPDGPSAHTVTVTVSDGELTGDDDSAVTVDNVAPTIAISGAASVNEGSSYSLTLGAVTDPGTDTVSSYVVHWGDGNTDTYTSNGVKTHTYADGPNNYAITVDLTDEDGTYLDRANAKSVTVDNVAPTATLANNGPVNEGSPATVSFSNQFDPSSTDTAAGFHYAFSCTNGVLPTTYAAASSSSSTTCTFADNGSYTVSGRIFDKDDGYTTYTTTVVVNNVAPTATFTASSPINEGSSSTLSFTAASDPSSTDTSAGSHYSFACDGLTASLASTYATAGTASSTTCAFADNGFYTVRGRIFDKDSGYTDYSATVIVNNMAPVVSALTLTGGTGTACLAGNQTSLSFSFSDAGANDAPWAIDINWGDGSHTMASTNTQGAQGPFTHTYGPGVFTVSVKVTDKDGGYGTSSSSTGAVSHLYTASGVLQPVNDTQAHQDPSIFKYGSTIPVKIRVTDCTGAAVSGLSPQISVKKIAGSTPPSGVDETITSTSGADSGTTMRYDGAGQYIYNLATKSLSDSTATYQITITGPFADVTALFGTKNK